MLPDQGFSRGSSSYRGVTAHPSGRWESRIGVPGSKHVYLGLYEDERKAAKAYDMALVRLRGANAATNYSLSEYKHQLAEYHQIQQVRMTVTADISASHGGKLHTLTTVYKFQQKLCLLQHKCWHTLMNIEHPMLTLGMHVLTGTYTVPLAVSCSCILSQHHVSLQAVSDGDDVVRAMMTVQSGPDFEQWIKQGCAAFGIEVGRSAIDQAAKETDATVASGCETADSTDLQSSEPIIEA